MIRQATDRFLLATLATVAGALTALLAGLPEAAVLVTPWGVLLVLGLRPPANPPPTVAVTTSHDRVIAGDELTVTTSIDGVTGSVDVTCLPTSGFGPVLADGSGRGVAVADGGRADVVSPLTPTQWGSHDVGQIHLEITSPYGLFRDRRRVGRPAPVRVHPTPVELRNLLKPWLVRRVAGTHESSAVARGIEYADTRPFAPGDSLRDINWRASARSDELWVSQRHPDRATDVILLVDSFVESELDMRQVVGLAIEAAVGLAESHLAVTDRVGVIELGGVVRWVTPRTGRHHLQRLTDALLATNLFANAAERDLAVIAPQALPPRSFVVALSPLLDARFVDALYVLSRRGHDVAVIECTEPELDGDESEERVARTIARRVWAAERQIVRDRLTESGVAVARWHRGVHLDQVLAVLTRRRVHIARAGR